MDILQEYIPQLIHLYTTCEPYTRPLRSSIHHLQNTLYPFLLPYLNTLAHYARTSPAIVTIGITVAILFLVLQILAFMQRIMMFWFRLMWRLVFWSTVIGIGAVVVQRGVGRTFDDLVFVGGELSRVWWREYKKWEGLQERQRVEGSAYGGYGSGSSMRSGRARTGWR